MNCAYLWYVLCISTSELVHCTPFASQNKLFQHFTFLVKCEEKGGKAEKKHIALAVDFCNIFYAPYQTYFGRLMEVGPTYLIFSVLSL